MVFESDEKEYVTEPENGDDILSEDVAEEYLSDTVKKLREELKQAKKERQEFLDGWQRSKADFLNSKKRTENEWGTQIKRVQMGVVERLLPLCDSFDMAFKNKEAWSSIDKTWAQGIEGIYAQLQSILRDYDVTEIEAEGKPFDPTIHDAYTSVPVPEAERHDTVVEVAQKGYRMGDTVIRPARVVIGRHDA